MVDRLLLLDVGLRSGLLSRRSEATFRVSLILFRQLVTNLAGLNHVLE